MAVQPPGCTPAAYRRRNPVDSPLYRALRNHLETFLAVCRSDWEDERVSPHAERELRRYLECGILAYAFARLRSWMQARPRPHSRGVLTGSSGQRIGRRRRLDFLSLLKKGDDFARRGEVQEAERIYRRLLEIDPDHFRATKTLEGASFLEPHRVDPLREPG